MHGALQCLSLFADELSDDQVIQVCSEIMLDNLTSRTVSGRRTIRQCTELSGCQHQSSKRSRCRMEDCARTLQTQLERCCAPRLLLAQLAPLLMLLPPCVAMHCCAGCANPVLADAAHDADDIITTRHSTTHMKRAPNATRCCAGRAAPVRAAAPHCAERRTRRRRR